MPALRHADAFHTAGVPLPLGRDDSAPWEERGDVYATNSGAGITIKAVFAHPYRQRGGGTKIIITCELWHGAGNQGGQAKRPAASREPGCTAGPPNPLHCCSAAQQRANKCKCEARHGALSACFTHGECRGRARAVTLQRVVSIRGANVDFPFGPEADLPRSFAEST